MSSPSFSPCKELRGILLPAYEPCRNFSGACAGVATWDPKAGHIPRGFIGALGSLGEIALVLITAEPANPLPGEVHKGANPGDYMERCCKTVYGHFERRASAYHSNIRGIIDDCFPGLSLSDQLRKTWIIDTYLCSAPVVEGKIPPRSEAACAKDYLYPQLELLRGRALVAMGGKARERLARFDGRFLAVGSPAQRSGNTPSVRETWTKIPGYLASRVFRAAPKR